jgi:ABC-type dipeptide/oligopeptide/nickel transport system permease subunit
VRCVLPNSLSPVPEQALLVLASSIITKSHLSFPGLEGQQDRCSLHKAADQVRAVWSAANADLVAGAQWSLIAKDPNRLPSSSVPA